jgi:hypothetical protein
MGVGRSLGVENAAAAQRYAQWQKTERALQRTLQRDLRRERLRLRRPKPQPLWAARTGFWWVLAAAAVLWTVL